MLTTCQVMMLICQKKWLHIIEKEYDNISIDTWIYIRKQKDLEKIYFSLLNEGILKEETAICVEIYIMQEYE
jgi:hypothetical protein